MSLYGSLMGDVEEDPFFGSHMRHMRQMNNMMNSLFADPFGMMGAEGQLALMGQRHGNAMMPYMPQMPNMNRFFTEMDGSMTANMANTMHHQIPGSTYSSSTVVMSSGPGGKPQVYSSSSSTKIGPHGVKETRKTVQDSRTGTKKMAIGHHIGERAHVIEREQNYYTGDAEQRQEFINLEEEEAEDFDREFQLKSSSGRPAIQGAPRREAARLALPAPPSPPAITVPNTSSEGSGRRHSSLRPSSRRPIRTSASPLTVPSSPSVREMYSGAHPQRQHRHKQHKAHASPPPVPPHAHQEQHAPPAHQAHHAHHAPHAHHAHHAHHAPASPDAYNAPPPLPPHARHATPPPIPPHAPHAAYASHASHGAHSQHAPHN